MMEMDYGTFTYLYVMSYLCVCEDLWVICDDLGGEFKFECAINLKFELFI